jgi:ssDNA-specific exonuclease RecJ
LGYTPKFSEILIDVVMGDVVYFTTKMATKEEFKRFYKRLLQKFQIGEEEFFEALSLCRTF